MELNLSTKQTKNMLRNNLVYYLVRTNHGYRFYNDTSKEEKCCLNPASADYIITRDTNVQNRVLRFRAIKKEQFIWSKIHITGKGAYIDYESIRINFIIRHTKAKYNGQKLSVLIPINLHLLEMLYKTKGFALLGIANSDDYGT